MRSRKPYLIFWPQYFDAKRSRSEGRRVSKKLAIEKVNPKEIAKAATKLGYKSQIEGGLKYPRTWWDDPGRVLVNTQGKKKNKVLIQIAKEIKKMRARS